MSSSIFCLGCRLHKPANPRLKVSQHYCGERACQRERKNAWQKAQRAASPNYRARQNAAQAQWRSERPLHRYQKEYREAHPEYVRNNREQQCLRNQKRRARDASIAPTKIVKMDALPEVAITSGLYLLTPCSLDASAKIVKMDAFMVALQVYHDDNASARVAFG